MKSTRTGARHVKSRAHADQHRSLPPEDRDSDVPTVSADFCFFDTWEELARLTAIVLCCDTTFYTFARVCAGKSTRKETYNNELVRYCVWCLDMLGWRKAIFKTDQEAAMEALQERVRETRVHETLTEFSPKCNPSSNGAAEKAVQ